MLSARHQVRDEVQVSLPLLINFQYDLDQKTATTQLTKQVRIREKQARPKEAHKETQPAHNRAVYARCIENQPCGPRTAHQNRSVVYYMVNGLKSARLTCGISE